MKTIVFFISFLFVNFWAYTQSKDTIYLAKLDRPQQALIQSDEMEKFLNFGVEASIKKDVEFTLAKGLDNLYSKVLCIKTQDANSINVLLENIELANMVYFEFTSSGGKKLGPYSNKDLTKLNHFLSWPIEGNTLYIRFYSTQKSSVKFHVNYVVYGLLENISTRSFGQSGFCNVNVNCPEGINWQQEKRSVVMLLNGAGTRFCTGALVNNTVQDGRPYILTAKHCNASWNTAALFNYESPDCSNIDGPTIQTIQGASVIAEYGQSDFSLIELNHPVPDSYFSYFSGWDRSGIVTDSSVGIHHPRGDIKKISADYNVLADSCYACANPAQDYWLVRQWDYGTTEPTSSGSPLFNKNGLIIGQLRGGQASCANSINDYYGKFSVSWEGGGTPQSRLKDWLDPIGSAPLTLGGMLNTFPNPNLDAKMNYFNSTENYICTDSVWLYASVINTGNIPIKKFCYSINNASTQCDSGNWYFGDDISFSRKIEGLNVGENAFNIHIEVFDGLGNSMELEYQTNTEKIPSAPLLVYTNYDNFPNENSWYIISNTTGDTLKIENGNASNPGQTTIRELCLPTDCYRLVLKDSNTDGMCCDYGNGSMVVLSALGDTIFKIAEFKEQAQFDFCFPYAKFSAEELFVYPNPTVDYVNVLIPEKYVTDDLEIIVSDMLGRIVMKKPIKTKYLHTFDVSNWAKGVYLVYIKNKKNKAFAKIVKK